MSNQFAPASGTEYNITQSVNETVWGGNSDESIAGYPEVPTSSGINILEYGGIDKKTIDGHSAWVNNMQPWSRRIEYTSQYIEPQPPSGWLFRFPSAVPIRPDARTLTEYGPQDFLPYDNNGLYYPHHDIGDELQYYHTHTLMDGLEFMQYGLI